MRQRLRATSARASRMTLVAGARGAQTTRTFALVIRTFPPRTTAVSTMLRPALAKLAADPATANSKRLWRAMTVDERRQALEALLRTEPENPVLRAALKGEIAKARNFRPQVVAKWDDARLADTISRLEPKEQSISWDALAALHIHGRTSMLTQFLDAIGIPHKDGLFEDVPAEPISESKLRPAVDGLLSAFDEDAVVLYLLALRASQPVFGGVDGRLKELAQESMVG